MRKNERVFYYLLTLLESFPPSAWREELYVRSPHFTSENLGGKVVITPTRRDAELVLDDLAPRLSLKKRRGEGNHYYVVSKPEVVRALNIFNWFVRRSWRVKEVSIVWALAYVAKAKGWEERPIPLGSVAEISGYDPLVCAEVIEKLVKAEPQGGGPAHGDYTIDRQQITRVIRELAERLPTWSEELVMSTLCCRPGLSVEDVYKLVMEHGLSLRAVYKIVEKLKRENYIVRLRYYRVSTKGPMRELLSANCRNCFYGHTTEERCFQDTMRQVEHFIKRHYGKELAEEDKVTFYKTLRLIPYSSRALKRVLIALRLLHELNSLRKEGYLATMLRKFEEKYGLKILGDLSEN